MDDINHYILWKVIWSSYRELAWVGFEPTSTEFHSDALTDWAIRPWSQLVLVIFWGNQVSVAEWTIYLYVYYVYTMYIYIYIYVYISYFTYICTRDAVGLYPDTPHEEGLIAIREDLDTRKDKTISTDSLVKLAEYALKITSLSTINLWGTAIGTKMAPPYAFIFRDSLEEDIMSNRLLKPFVCWCYVDDIMCEHGEEELQNVRDSISSYYKVYSRILLGKNKFSGCYCYQIG